MTVVEFLDSYVTDLKERDVIVVTSKVVALCQGRVVPINSIDKEELIRREADYYSVPGVASQSSRYHYTIVNNTFNFAAGIDESNGNGDYVLWPNDPQREANQIRQHLRARFHLQHVGVIITDSTISLSRWGTIGIAIAHSGFLANKNYIGTPDIFGRILHLSQANVAGGIAAAAVLCMGEGAERTPLAIVNDVPFVKFRVHNPTDDELHYYISPLNDEPFKPFFRSVPWERGHTN
jgi:F420-0:gamma-glutamyl ligase